MIIHRLGLWASEDRGDRRDTEGVSEGLPSFANKDRAAVIRESTDVDSAWLHLRVIGSSVVEAIAVLPVKLVVKADCVQGRVLYQTAALTTSLFDSACATTSGRFSEVILLGQIREQSEWVSSVRDWQFYKAVKIGKEIS